MMRTGLGIYGLALAAAAGAFGPALAASQSFSERLALDPLSFEVKGIEIQAGGSAQGAAFAQSEGGQKSGSGLATANLRLRKIFDNGMILGARSDFLLFRDALSGDYGNDTVQKLYLFLQTGFGRLDIGQQEGASASLGLRGPLVDSKINLADRGITLFRDPQTGSSLVGLYAPMVGIAASSNFAKLAYTTPRLFGVQAALSYTPQAVRSPLPFTGNPANTPTQQNILEAALAYTGYFSNTAIGLSADYVRGNARNGTAGFSDLSEWSVGGQIAHTFSEVKLSVGGAYRQTNAYLLNIRQVLDGSRTGVAHLSTTAEWGDWVIGFEHSFSNADGPVNYRIRGFQFAAGYRVNANLQISAGWQRFQYRRNIGTFFNGLPQLDLDAAFLSLGYTI